MPGSPVHLVRRFFDVATARSLDTFEETAVGNWLEPRLADLFFDQPSYDQRHGYEAALSVIAQGQDDQEVITAALLHDIGKRHSRLGLIGRSFGSMMILLRLPLPGRVATYRDHGLVGAGELGRAGAPALAIDFTLHHHGDRPGTISADVWDALVTADQPPKTRGEADGRIISTTT